MKYDSFESGIQAYIDFMIADYNRGGWREDMKEAFKNSFSVREGKKYFKIIRQHSVCAFVVKKDDGQFQAGDILKAASYAAPAKNSARGNVLKGEFSGGWTGPAYLK